MSLGAKSNYIPVVYAGTRKKKYNKRKKGRERERERERQRERDTHRDETQR